MFSCSRQDMCSAHCVRSREALCFERRACHSSVGRGGKPRSFTLGKSHRLCVRPSTKPCRFHFGLASAPPPQKKRRTSPPYGDEVSTRAVRFAVPDPSKAGLSESRRAKREWKTDAPSGIWKEMQSIQNRLQLCGTSKEKLRTENRGDSRAQSPEAIRPGANRGSTTKTWLISWSSNAVAGCLRLCKATTSSLPLLPWWIFLRPLL